MGERKVLNKYFPPDFDPAKLPKRKRPKNEQIKVRMMLPMSIRCETCGNYIYKGTKFNSRKEDVLEETYLGIMIFRFYFKCTRCSAEITMKTDPQNSDYIVESGASRNYEPWREKDQAKDEAVKTREAEEQGDAMKALENRTLDSKQEMDIMAALDEMKSMKARHASVGTEDMLAALRKQQAEQERALEEEDERLIKSLVFGAQGGIVRRIDDEEEDAALEAEDEEPNKKRRGIAPRGDKERLSGGAGAGPSGSAAAVPDPLVDHAAPVEMHGGAKAVQEAKKALPPRPKVAAPSFAVKPKAVAFAVKPKASAVKEESGVNGPTKGLASSNGVHEVVKQESAVGLSTSKADVKPSNVLTSLVSSYDTDDSD